MNQQTFLRLYLHYFLKGKHFMDPKSIPLTLFGLLFNCEVFVHSYLMSTHSSLYQSEENISARQTGGSRSYNSHITRENLSQTDFYKTRY